ncbi:MAG TPA: histidine triad nucleotide-binding protein [Bdellovibrionota bacterium]|nr:histidine triad nucleotide-binding protein [Bdellovibrionota bacterium]
MNTSADCVFCKIIAGKIPSPRVYEDERFICIRDIRPQAKVHLLVVPREHVVSLETAGSELVGAMFESARKIAFQEKLLPSGFRSVINTGVAGGQTVWHLHLHLLGGETLGEHL